jgi:hypothetical protein
MNTIQQALVWDSDSIEKTCLEQLVSVHREYTAQQTDSILEREIISHQIQKKEPARSIARRLKQQKDGSSSMDEEDNDDAGNLSKDRIDMQDTWEKSLAEWEDHAVRPLQLALEITANLTSLPPLNEDEDEEMMMMMMTEEERTLPENIVKLVVEHHLADRLQQIMRQLAVLNRYASSNDVPQVVRDSIADLQCKASVGLGHCLANVSAWYPSVSLWIDMKGAMTVDGAVLDAITSTMVVALRSWQSIRAQIQQQDLNELLSLLTSTESSTVARNVISMLGILCSAESHPAEVNEKVCQTLLSVSSSSNMTTTTRETPSAMVMAEVLNALMDIYGDDDRHPAVFASLDVLGHFQRSLPLLKQRIRTEELTRSSSNEEIAGWKESAMNAARFIDYQNGRSL